MSALLERMELAETQRHDQARERYPKLIAAIAGGDNTSESETELAALIDALEISLADARRHISAVRDADRHQSGMMSADNLLALNDAAVAASAKLQKAQSDWLVRERKLTDEMLLHSRELVLAQRRNEIAADKIAELKRDNPLAFDPPPVVIEPVDDSPVIETGNFDDPAPQAETEIESVQLHGQSPARLPGVACA